MSKREDFNVGQLTIAGADNKGTTIKQYREISASVTPAAVGAATIAEQTIAGFTGLLVGDTIIGIKSAPVAHYAQAVRFIGHGRCTTAGSAILPFCNPTAGSLTPTSGTWVLQVLRT